MTEPDVKTLMIGPSTRQVGGMETLVSDLLNSTLKDKVELFFLDISKPRVQKLRSKKSSFLIDGLSYFYSLFFLLKFLWLLNIKRPQIIHIHTASKTSFWEKCAYIKLSKIFSKKVVLHIHGAQFDLFYKNSNQKKVIKEYLKKCDKVIVLSQYWYNFFENTIGISNLEIVSNGINLKPYQKINVPKTEIPSILFLGELTGRKGVEMLLESLARLNFEYRAFLYGNGDHVHYQNLANKLNLQNKVEINPLLNFEQKINALKKSWILVLPSFAEGQPMVLIEALAAGLPAISTMVGGIPKVIEDEQNGFLVKPGDIENLSQKIETLCFDNQLRSIVQKNNLEKSEFFSIENVSEKIFRIYKHLA